MGGAGGTASAVGKHGVSVEGEIVQDVLPKTKVSGAAQFNTSGTLFNDIFNVSLI